MESSYAKDQINQGPGMKIVLYISQLPCHLGFYCRLFSLAGAAPLVRAATSAELQHQAAHQCLLGWALCLGGLATHLTALLFHRDADSWLSCFTTILFHSRALLPLNCHSCVVPQLSCFTIELFSPKKVSLLTGSQIRDSC